MIKKMQKGFSLARLFFIIAGLGLLGFVAAASLPTYHEYGPRDRVAELILSASSAKTALSEGMQTYGSFSSKWTGAITISSTGVVKSASVNPDTGVIKAWGTAPAADAVITMTPTVTTDNKLVWSCTGTPVKYMPAMCR